MPLPNRVDPFGELLADPARGLFFGNRGGRFHRDDRTLGARRWASRQWICCRLDFKGRRREVWGAGYTELFFLDEPTALAAGHRPCFECRRKDAQAFAAAMAAGLPLAFAANAPPRWIASSTPSGSTAARKRRHRLPIDDLPDGAFLTLPQEPAVAFAVRGDDLLRWTPAGYASRQRRPAGIDVDVLTPPSILAALSAGYRPLWHPSAGK